MVRTLITISEEDKRWLEYYSRKNHQSLAQTIRKAINQFRRENRKSFYKESLDKTQGLWKSKKINSLAYVQNLRREWER